MTSDTMTWRAFAGSPDSPTCIVTTYETPIGKPCDPEHSTIVGSIEVTRDEAVRMLRTEAAS